MKFPKGLYYDPIRKRWRARLVSKGITVHVSYHNTQQAAQQAYTQAVEQMNQTRICNPTSSLDLLKTLRFRYG